MSVAGGNKPIIEVIHPSPDEAWKMPYVPAVSHNRRLRSDVLVGLHAFEALSQPPAHR